MAPAITGAPQLGQFVVAMVFPLNLSKIKLGHIPMP
jgi:hypothetical protein